MNVCKWCGCDEIMRDGFPTINGGREVLDLRQRCLELRLQHEQTIEILKAREANTVEALRGHIEDLQRRLADALAALAAIERHEAGSDLEFESVSQHGEWVLFEDLELVRDILVGNSPEQLEDEQ